MNNAHPVLADCVPSAPLNQKGSELNTHAKSEPLCETIEHRFVMKEDDCVK